jgi:hypothetical protein
MSSGTSPTIFIASASAAASAESLLPFSSSFTQIDLNGARRMKSEVPQPVLIGIVAVVVVVVVALGWIMLNREPKQVGTSSAPPQTAAPIAQQTGGGLSKSSPVGGGMAKPGVD